MEEWKQIKGYEGFYEVSSYGRIRSFHYAKTKEIRIITPIMRSCNYFSVGLSINKVKSRYLIHRLVASTFIPNPKNKPFVNHKNGIKTDNRLINLEWCTRIENAKHASENDLMRHGENNTSSKLKNEQVLFIRLNKDIITASKLSKMFGVSKSTILSVIKNKTWTRAYSYPQKGM